MDTGGNKLWDIYGPPVVTGLLVVVLTHFGKEIFKIIYHWFMKFWEERNNNPPEINPDLDDIP